METKRDRSFKHFDLPVHHLSRHAHYIPPRAREQSEITRRRLMRRGVLLAEQQQRGTAIAAEMLKFLGNTEDNFTPRIIAAAALNTAWHNHAQNAEDVMRRRLWLPIHSRSNVEVSRDSLIELSVTEFEAAASLAALYRLSLEKRSAAEYGVKKKLGRQLGNAALVLACVPQSRLIVSALDPFEQQYHTRQAALITLEASRSLEAHMGANPTLAQLADSDSPLAVYIRRSGTDASVEALEFAASSGTSSL